MVISKVKFLKKRIPLAIRWQITDRCVSQCRYCSIWKTNVKELSTQKILEILREISICGTRKISFSGGEPLLRDDVGEIITYCKKLGISPEINSTGYFLEKRIKEIKDLDLLKISLDGPAEINELSRGKKESYQWAINAASCAQANNIRFIFTTTLTKFNIDYVEDVMRLAKSYNTLVAFQPLKEIGYENIATENLDSLAPTQDVFKKTINLLIRYKKKKELSMRNSLGGLRHIYNWPCYEKIKCWGGKIFCMISASGEVSPCDRIRYTNPLPNCAEIGFQKAFNSLPPLPSCAGCGFCGSIELNYLMSFKFNNLGTMRKIVT